MSSYQLFVLILISVLIVMLPSYGIAAMFKKAGVPAWKAYIPFYNTYVMQQLANRPKHWVFWQFIPIVGWFISMGIFIEWVKVFGKFSFWEHTLAALVPFLYFPYLGNNKDDRFLGPEVVKKHKKSTAREWVDAGIFAVVAATLIRTFIFEAYTIPTGSMEKTLLVNDFLFVSKFKYGPRIPNTPLAMPFVHHTMPFGNMKSYTEIVKLPYIRWFASPVKRNDVVVFNFPTGDTVINRDEFQSKDPYYDVARRLGNGDINLGRNIIMNDPDTYPLVVRPVDKKENYIKRCVAIAGDTLMIKDGVVYIDGKQGFIPPHSEIEYEVETGGQPLDHQIMKDEYNIDIDNPDEFQPANGNKFMMLLTYEAATKMQKSGLAKAIRPLLHNASEIPPQAWGQITWPYDTLHKWTVDDFGPLWVPAKGATLTLTADNYSLYERAIRTYEGNTLEMKNGKFYINNVETDKYTFKMNYFWMMGDNRHGSQDSRYWGFVPEDHIVGSASLIWMSWDKGIRWKRLFKTIK